jgi:hypothetical protein
MLSGLLSKISRYVLYLLVWVLTFSHHGQGAALVAERSDGDSPDSPVLAPTTTTLTPIVPANALPRNDPSYQWKSSGGLSKHWTDPDI